MESSRLEIIKTQPKANFHYRYESELNSTHGIVSGRQAETYPTIQLQLPDNGNLDECNNQRDFFVLCSLHSYTTKPHSLSPYQLLKKGQKTIDYEFIFQQMEVDADNPTVRTWALKDYVIVRLKPSKYRQALEKKQQHFTSLGLPMDFKELQGNVIIDDENSVKSSGILNVCLGFTIFERDFYTNTFRLYKETIYSDNIFHGDDLKIHKLCNIKDGVVGGTEVTLLVNIQSSYEYNVHMYYPGNSWEEYIPVLKNDVFKNAAITFVLPEGPAVKNADEIEVMLEVMVARTTYKSSPISFRYINNTQEELPHKKARPHTTSSATASSVSGSDLPLDSGQCTEFDNTNTFEEFMFELEKIYDETVGYQSIENCPLPNRTSDNCYQHPPDDEEYRAIDPNILHSHHVVNSSTMDSTLHNHEAQIQDNSVSYDHVVQVEDNPPVTPPAESIIKNEDIDEYAPHRDKIDTALGILLAGMFKDQIVNNIFYEAIKHPRCLLKLYRKAKDSTRIKDLVINARNNLRQNLLHYACAQNMPNAIRPLIGIGCRLDEQDSQGRTPLHICIEQHYDACISIVEDLLKDYSKYSKEVEEQLIRMLKACNHRGYTVLHEAVQENQPQLVKAILAFCQLHQLDVLQYVVLGNGDSIVHIMARRNLFDMIEMVKEYVPNYLRVQNYAGETAELLLQMFEALNVNDTNI